MKYIFKLTIILITFTLVSYDQRYLLNKQFIKPEQATLATRKPGPPLGRSALNRLAEHITIEVVTPIVVFGGGYTAVGSGVIIGKKDSTYYVLTAKHIFRHQGDYRVSLRSKRPGEDLEVVKLQIISGYPDVDLVVVAFASRRQYKVAKIGEPSELKKNSKVYIGGWPSVDNRDGFQFTPAKVTNPRAKEGDSLAYEPTETGEDVYPGMSGGPVLNEEGHLMGIHVGLMELDGDGKGLLVSAFLREIPEQVEEVLVRVTPDIVSAAPTEKGDVELQRQLAEERRKREEAERRLQELEAEREKELEEAEQRAKLEQAAELERQREQLESERRKREEAERRSQELEAEREKARKERAKKERAAELQWQREEKKRRRQEAERQEEEEKAKKQRQVENEISLASARGVDYRKLRDLLAVGRWKEADQETDRVMLKAARRESEGYLRKSDVENFSCQDLRTIDKLWVKYSNGNFGFSVQKQIYQSVGGTKEFDYDVWIKFGDKVGWRKGGQWLDYSELTLKEHYRG
ncbi:MAG: GUN4 domain-containing protein, partial [Trichodesmium sp. St18_bin1]|nr:GUN4 domain-containing protein [Trichodesmium sp. St18_bin1]